ncbi:MAG: nucleotidyltransferase, partial [Hyphomicrobiaceae bacterium]
IRDIEQASLYGRLLRVANPVCEDDVFTDRWPDSIAQQNEFADHLRDLVRSLEAMRKGEMFPNTMMDVLRNDFGDRVVTRAADQIATDVGGGIQQSRQLYTRRGGVLLPSATALVTPIVNPSVAAARPHTFFGRKI